MMRQGVHVLAKHLPRFRESEKTQACRIDESAIAFQIDAVNRFGRGIEQQACVLIAFLKCGLHILACSGLPAQKVVGLA